MSPHPLSPRTSTSLLAWINALALSPTRASSSAELHDGALLSSAVQRIDSEFFAHGVVPPEEDSWVLRYNTLKRLHKSILRYFAEVIGADAEALSPPDLQAIAQTASEPDLVALISLVLTLCVQSEKAQEHVALIQTLDQAVQAELMTIIERHVKQIGGLKGSPDLSQLASDSEIHADTEELKSERDTLQKVYEDLLRQHTALRGDQDAALRRIEELEAAAAAASTADRPPVPSDDSHWRHELDGARLQLDRAEAALSEAEATVERQRRDALDSTKRIDELTERAIEADKLRDEIDEYRHAADRLVKAENTLDKYKKKLEEAADVRRALKTVEEQNSDLLERHGQLEDEYRKVAAFKPLMDQYKAQVADLETGKASATREADELRYELDKVKERLRVAEEERTRQSETVALYEERVKELELGSKRRVSGASLTEEDDVEGGELGDAMAGTTMTDLKLQIRRLKREVEEAKANKSDASRVVVLENLLEDANRMKTRYQDDYLREHRDRLLLVNQLDEIRSGKQGNGPEVAAALRIRLNETVEELDKLQRHSSGLEARATTAEQHLARAQSDLKLVDRDRLDVLAALRAEVATDKLSLEQDVLDLRNKLREATDRNAMHLQQVNTLLLDKVGMQGQGIDHREMLLKQERAISELRSSGGNREEAGRLETELASARTEVAKALQQLSDAKDLIRKQDRRLKDAAALAASTSFDDSEQGLRSQIIVLKDELERQKTLSTEIEERYRREHKLILSAWHDLGVQRLRDQASQRQNGGGNGRPEPMGWLGQQRARAWVKPY